MRTDASASHPFRYCADPLCVTAAIVCLLNRFILRPYDVGGVLTTWYLNDVLCLPLFTPISLYMQRRLRLRLHDGPPRAWELAQHAAVFSIVFELVLPRFPDMFRSTADPLDVVAYLAGSAAAWGVWSRQPVSLGAKAVTTLDKLHAV